MSLAGAIVQVTGYSAEGAEIPKMLTGGAERDRRTVRQAGIAMPLTRPLANSTRVNGSRTKATGLGYDQQRHTSHDETEACQVEVVTDFPS
jgi:hypothetical protein